VIFVSSGSRGYGGRDLTPGEDCVVANFFVDTYRSSEARVEALRLISSGREGV